MRNRLLPLVILISLAIGGCARPVSTAPVQTPVLLFVAASTKDVAEQLAREFKTAHGIDVEVSPGPSSGLAKQIFETGKADLFLSADQPSADYLASKGLVAERKNLLTNRLAVIVPADSKLTIKDFQDLAKPEVKRIALAEPKVPAGEYARDALRKSDVLAAIEPKIVGGVDVRSTLQFVARGEVDAGIVYVTDTIGNSKVKMAFEVDPKLHRPIEYPLVLIKHTPANPAAKRLYEQFSSPAAAETFRRAGFGLAR